MFARSIHASQDCTWSQFSVRKKKKSRFISTHLSDHEGKIGWGPCDESAELIKHILLILLGIT